MKTEKNVKRLLKVSSVLCLLMGGLVSISEIDNQTIQQVKVCAATDIESSTGVTLNKNDVVSITKTSNWSSKSLVFDIKTDGTETQFQLIGSSGSTGIIRSGNVAGTDYSASMCAIGNSKHGETDEAYWWANTVETLSDGWYRWYVSLANLKSETMSNEAVSFGCIKGSNVQVKNLQFLDGQVLYGGSGTKLHLANTFSNWKDTTLQVDVNYSTGNQRRFQLCKTSGSGVSGIIRLTTEKTIVENVAGSPYWLELGAPTYLGNNWYRHTIDLSKLKIADKRDGTESVNQIAYLPDSSNADPNSLQIRNFRVGNEVYNPTTDAQATISTQYTNLGTTISSDDWFIEDSKDNNITFDVYGLPLNSFVFSFANGESRKTAKFKFYENGEIKISEAGVNPVDTVVGSYTEGTNGWQNVSINLYSLRQSTGADINAIRVDSLSGNIYLKDLSLYKPYLPENEADIVLKAGERTEIPNIASWGRSTISFEVYHDSLDLTCDPQFIFGKKDSESNITSYFGYKQIGEETALWLRNASDEGGYWAKSTNQPVATGDGWFKWTIDLSELRAEASTGAETIGNIYNRGAYDVYIRNFNIDSVEDISKQEGVLTLKAGERTEIPNIASWSRSTISFEVYQGSLDLFCDPQFIFGKENLDKNITSYFGYKQIGEETALWLRNTSDEGKYWVKSTNQPVATGNGWYKWTIDLSELRAEASSGAETIGNILNRGEYDVYIRNFNIDSVEDISKQEGVLTLKAGVNNVLPEYIPYWQYSTITFEIYQGSLDLFCDPQFQFIMENSDKYVSGFFGYKQIGSNTALWLRNAKSGDYWAKSTNQPIEVGEGWYKWTINLSELGNGEYCTGVETIAKIRNRGAYDVYIRNLTIESDPFVMLNKKELTVPYEEGLTETISARIIKGNGQIVYSSSDETVATVNQNGKITFLKVGSCEITASVENNTEIKSATCNITVVGLKDYKTFNLNELTDGESSIDFPLVSSLTDNVKTYSYDPISEENPSVVIRFLVNTSYLEQNRQAVTIWGPQENGLSNGNYGMWAACYQGALVFDIYGNNGSGGLKVNGINTTALNSHNTEVQSMITNAYYYIEAGAIDLVELVNDVQYTYFYIKVNGNLVWSTIDVANDEYRNPLVVFTAVGASRSKASAVELVDVTLVTPDGEKVVQVANGLTLPNFTEPEVTEEGKKFIGWAKEDGSLWDFDSETVDGAMTLTAKITSEYSTISFDLNYDDNGTYISKYVGNGMLVKEPAEEPAREGYRFDHWSTSKDGDAFNFYSPINQDTTLYAIWVKIYKVSFVYDGATYLSINYDENSNVVDPKWGYKDKPDFGEWADRGMFKLNQLANGRAPYYSLTENGEKIDLDTANIKVTGDMVIYIQFKEVETVMKENEVYDPNTSKWDYVSIRDLNDTSFVTDDYSVTKYDTSTAEYSPSKNNTTDSVIFRGEMILGEKFKGANVNVGNIALRSSLNAYNSVYLWLRAKEVYLEAKDNSKSVHLAFQSYDMVDGIDAYVEEINGVTYLKTDTYIPIEYAILAVTTEGFEDYDRVYFKIGGVTIFDVMIPNLCKSAEGASYRVGFVTDSDTATNAALTIKGVYPDFVVEFKDKDGNTIQDSVTLTKYSYVEEPAYTLPPVEGKTFVGWYDANTMEMWNFGKDRITSHLVLVPTYGYKVIIDPNEGAFADGRTDKQMYDPRQQLVGENCKVNFPADPVYSSNDGFTYKFGGWVTEDGVIWDPEKDVVTSDVTLKAKWIKYVTITYYIEDNDYKWESKTIKFGSIVGSPKHGDPDSYDAFDDDEHEFIGWYMFNEDGDFVEVNLDELEANGSYSIYAMFDDGTGDIEEPEKPNVGGCSGFKDGCSGAVGSILALLPVLLFMFIKKKRLAKSR